MPRFQADQLSIAQIQENLKVLATFRTQEKGSSNLTIREGIFKKTTGKLNLFKGIVRDAEDSLTNQNVIDEITRNLGNYLKQLDLKNKSETEYDILCNAMYGFLNLGSKYRGRNGVDNIVQAMSTVCRQAKDLFFARLGDRYMKEKAAAFSQGVYNQSNGVHLGGTCWAMVMDWARRFVLKGKMGYAHNLNPLLPYNQNKLLHRGKYIAHVFGLDQNIDYADIGDAIKNGAASYREREGKIDATGSARIKQLLQQYNAERKPNSSKKTVEEKFSKLSCTRERLELGHSIHIGNQDYGGANTRERCINALTGQLQSWIDRAEAEYNKKQFYLFAHGINFFFKEEIGYQKWFIHNARQQQAAGGQNNLVNVNLFGNINNNSIIDQSAGHALGFAYDPNGKKCYFMDPNYGEWVLDKDPRKVAELIYDVLKTYTAGKEKGFSNPLYICRSIWHLTHSLFAKSP
jgi:hypothetical protein